jgi:phosphoribosylformylglycinamidine synthase
MQWIFSGNLIPSAAGKTGAIQDLLEASPIRPGKFWALEKRFRAGVTDNVSRTALEAFEIVLGRKIPQGRAASGGILLCEGPGLNEDQLAVIARDVFCNELIE